MSKPQARHRRKQQRAQHTQSDLSRPRRLSRRKLMLVIGIGLLLSLTGGLFAQWRAARVTSKLGLPAPVPTPTPSPLSLSKEYIYTGGKLVATEEPSTISMLVTAPTALVASTGSAAQLNLSWTASTGPVAHYQIERSLSINGPYTLLASETTTNSFTDTSVSSGTAYLYHVRAVDTSGSFSQYSNIDLATAVSFIDDPLASNTPIKAQHLLEIRQAVNAVRVAAGLSVATWTDASPQGVRIKAQHVQEMRTALDQALGALSLPIQPYTDSSLTNGRIKKEHFQQLRDRVK